MEVFTEPNGQRPCQCAVNKNMSVISAAEWKHQSQRRPGSVCCTSPHLNATEMSVLLWKCLSGESPAALFMGERQTHTKRICRSKCADIFQSSCLKWDEQATMEMSIYKAVSAMEIHFYCTTELIWPHTWSLNESLLSYIKVIDLAWNISGIARATSLAWCCNLECWDNTVTHFNSVPPAKDRLGKKTDTTLCYATHVILIGWKEQERVFTQWQNQLPTVLRPFSVASCKKLLVSEKWVTDLSKDDEFFLCILRILAQG